MIHLKYWKMVIVMEVLIVDGDVQNFKTLSKLVQGFGHPVHQARTIQEATAVADLRVFDLVFIDLNLPDGNGFRLIPRLKRAWPETRIITMTGSNSRDQELEARGQGVIYHLLRPDDEDIIKSILTHISGKLNHAIHDQALKGKEDQKNG